MIDALEIKYNQVKIGCLGSKCYDCHTSIDEAPYVNMSHVLMCSNSIVSYTSFIITLFYLL